MASLEKIFQKLKIYLPFAIVREFFYFSFLAWLVLNLMEIIFPKIILVYFNLNYLFLLVIIFGFITLVQSRVDKNNL